MPPIDLDELESLAQQHEQDGRDMTAKTLRQCANELRSARTRLALADELAAAVRYRLDAEAHYIQVVGSAGHCWEDEDDAGKAISNSIPQIADALARYQSGGPSLVSLALAWAEAQRAANRAMSNPDVDLRLRLNAEVLRAETAYRVASHRDGSTQQARKDQDANPT